MTGGSGDDLAGAMARHAARVEAELDRLLPAAGDAPRLAAAMRYASLDGGKRVRPFLTYVVGTMLGAAEAPLTRAGAAIELIHCYSLVHDDLPAMDDAALRRGRPSCHRAFDEATAILAGDALQALAFEVLARDDWAADDGQRAALVAGLARAAGVSGMCGGQMLDLAAERADLDLDAVTLLQRLKTGAVIGFAAAAGCILARADERATAAVAGYAAGLGLAFQIKDDLLDVESDAGTLGKDAGRDAARGKATFVAHLGIEGARRRLIELAEDARGRLDSFGPAATLLVNLFQFVITRKI